MDGWELNPRPPPAFSKVALYEFSKKSRAIEREHNCSNSLAPIYSRLYCVDEKAIEEN
jgi:hypothetical protein